LEAVIRIYELHTKPVAKVDALDVHLAELLACAGRHENIEQGVLDISMTPVLSFNLRHRGDIAGTERIRRTNAADQQNQAGQEERPQGEFGERHVGWYNAQNECK
jgi:hypothetical protein